MSEVTITLRGQNLTGPMWADATKSVRGFKQDVDNVRISAKQIPSTFDEIGRAARGLKGSTDSLGSSFSGAFSQASSFAGVLGIGIGAGVGGIALGLKSLAMNAIDSADQIVDLSQKMGVSIEAAQRFGRAARQSGADIGNISQAIVQMNNRLVDGDKSTVEALKAAGLSIASLRAMKPEVAFRAIADAIGMIGDPMEQTNIAMATFGKQGAELLPMIRDGALAAADGMSVMDTATARELADAKDTWQNFWDDVTVLSAKAIAGIGRLLNPKYWMPTLGGTEPGRQPYNLPAFAKTAPVTDIATLLEKTKGMSPNGIRIDPASLGFSPEETAALLKSRQAEEAALKKSADEAERLAKRYAEYVRERETGLSVAERERRMFEEKYLRDRGLLDVYRDIDKLIDRSTKGALLLASLPSISLDYKKPLTSVNFNDPFSSNAVSLAAQKIFADAAPKSSSDAASFGRNAMGTMKGLLADAPMAIMGALQGGGSVKNSLAGMLSSGMLGAESFLGKMGTGVQAGIFEGGAGKFLQSKFGNSFGGALAGMIPGIGMFAGPAISALISGVSRLTGTNATKGGREGLAKDLGFKNLDKLYDDLSSMGEAGSKLANIGKNVVGRNDEAANKKWMADVLAFYQNVEGGADKAARAAADAARKQREALSEQADAQEFLTSTIQKYGFTVDELGPKWRAQRLKEDATLLLKEYTAITASGVDHETVQKKMGRALFDFLQTAKRTGAEVPLEFKKMAEEALVFHTLVGENGEQLENLDGITFAETFSQSVDRMITKLDELIRKITGDLGGALDTVGGLTGNAVEEGDEITGGSSGVRGGARSWFRGSVLRRDPLNTSGGMPMALGGEVVGPAHLFIEPGRRELVGDDMVMARAMNRVLDRRSSTGQQGGAVNHITVNLQAPLGSTIADMRQLVREDLVPAITEAIRSSGQLRVRMIGALALDAGFGI